MKNLLEYDKNTGQFTWKANVGTRAKRGRIAGSTCKKRGYIVIRVGGKSYLAHRLAWFFVNGRWPVGLIDHANNDRTDNRIVNLREADESQNARNTSSRKNSYSKYLGVSFDRSRNLWRARISIKGKNTTLGRFATEKEAAKCYNEAAKIHHKEFANLNKIC